MSRALVLAVSLLSLVTSPLARAEGGSFEALGGRAAELPGQTDVREAAALFEEVDVKELRAALASVPPARRRALLAEARRLTLRAMTGTVTLDDLMISSRTASRLTSTAVVFGLATFGIFAALSGLMITCGLKAHKQCGAFTGSCHERAAGFCQNSIVPGLKSWRSKREAKP